MASENQFLLHSLFLGVFITFVYDLLRIFRRVVPHGSFLVSMEDLAFWIYCGSEVFLLMYHESNGTLRWFAVIGALVGMVLYKKLVSSLFVKYVSLILNKILDIIEKILIFICRPLSFALGKAGKTCHKAGGRVRRRAGKIRRAIKLRLTFFLKALKINLKA